MAEMDEMRAWLLASLAFDPSRNGTALMHEFLRGFYGARPGPCTHNPGEGGVGAGGGGSCSGPWRGIHGRF